MSNVNTSDSIKGAPNPVNYEEHRVYCEEWNAINQQLVRMWSQDKGTKWTWDPNGSTSGYIGCLVCGGRDEEHLYHLDLEESKQHLLMMSLMDHDPANDIPF